MTGLENDIQQSEIQETHVILDKEALTNAALELEEAYTLRVFKLLDYTPKMEDMSLEIPNLLGGSVWDKTKQALFKQLFPQDNPLPDDQMDRLVEDWMSR